MKKFQKVLTLGLATLTFAGIGTSAFAVPTFENINNPNWGNVEVYPSVGTTRANVHDSYIEVDSYGTVAETIAYSYDGSPMYYLYANIQAYYLNGIKRGAYNYNSDYNTTAITSGTVTEKGRNRHFEGTSQAKMTSSSSTEFLSAETDIYR